MGTGRRYSAEMEQRQTQNTVVYSVKASVFNGLRGVGTVYYPTWWYTMAPAVLTFLKSCSWQGKTVIPFQTHGGWPGHVIKDIKGVCKGAEFSHEMEIQFDSAGGAELVTAEDSIDAWTEQIRGDVVMKPE